MKVSALQSDIGACVEDDFRRAREGPLPEPVRGKEAGERPGGANQAVFANGDEGRAVMVVLFRRTLAQEIAQTLLTGLLRRAALLHEQDDAVAKAGFHDLVALAGGGARADCVIHVEAGADDGRVADAARTLPGQAAG